MKSIAQARLLGSAIPVAAFLICLTILVSAGEVAYISNGSGNTVMLIDIASNKVIGQIGVGHSPFGVAVSADGSRAYVTNSGDATASVIDTSLRKVVATINVGPEPLGVVINPSATRVYVGNNGSGNNNSVSVIDTSSNAVIDTVTVGYGPGGMAVNPTGTRLYVVNDPASTLSVLDITEDPPVLIKTLSLNGSRGMSGVAVDQTGTYAYVAGSDSQLIHVVDLNNNTVVAEISLHGRPVGVALNSAGTSLYVTETFGANTVEVVDTVARIVVTTIPVGSNPAGVEVNPAGTQAYVANGSSGTVSIIDTATNIVSETINVGGGPQAFGEFITSPFLSFPLQNRTAFNARINSVFDHSMGAVGNSGEYQYCADRVTTAYTGEHGSSSFGASLVVVYNCQSSKQKNPLYGFKQANGQAFSINGQYDGGSDPNDVYYLFYDGHPGFDYKTTDQDPSGKIPVLAAASGKVVCVNVPSSCDDTSMIPPCTDGPAEIKIDNGNGYSTIYLHLSSGTVGTGQVVQAGQQIGVSGDTGACGNPHLHFEVREGVPCTESRCVPVDPYGWSGPGTDPYARRTANVRLWQ